MSHGIGFVAASSGVGPRSVSALSGTLYRWLKSVTKEGCPIDAMPPNRTSKDIDDAIGRKQMKPILTRLDPAGDLLVTIGVGTQLLASACTL